MLSTAAVNGRPTALQGEALGANGMSETEGFDFMNYLLGLGNPSDVAQGETDIANAGVKLASNANSNKDAVAQDPLMALFKNKEKSNAPWESVLPNMQGVTIQNPALANQPVTVITQKDATAIPVTDGKTNTRQELPGLLTTKMMPQDPKANPTGKEPVALATNRVHSKVVWNPDLASSPNAETEPKLASIGIASPKVLQSRIEKAMQKYGNDVSAMTPAQQTYSQIGKVAQGKVAQPTLTSNFTPANPTVSHSAANAETASIGVPHRKEDKQNSKDVFLGSGISVDNRGSQTSGSSALGVVPTKGEIHKANVPELFQKVESMVHHGGGKMTVSLNPPSLGHVEIHVTTKGKHVEIEMKSQTDQAKSAIEGQLNDLKHSLSAHDLHITKMEVHVSHEMTHTEGQHTSFSQHGNLSHQQGQSRGFAKNSEDRNLWRSQPNSAPTRIAQTIPLTPSRRNIAQAPGRVDLRI